MSIWSSHHGDTDMLIPQASDFPRPFSLDLGPSFEFEPQIDEEIHRLVEIVDDDPHVVHSHDGHRLAPCHSAGLACPLLGAVENHPMAEMGSEAATCRQQQKARRSP